MPTETRSRARCVAALIAYGEALREPTIAIDCLLRQRQIAAIEKRQRRIDELAQQRRVIVVRERDGGAAQRIDLLAKFIVPPRCAGICSIDT